MTEIATTTPDLETPGESASENGGALPPESPPTAEGNPGESVTDDNAFIEALMALRAMFDGAEMPETMFRDFAILVAFHAMTTTRSGNDAEHFDASIKAAAGMAQAMIRARREAQRVDKVA